MHVKLRGKKCAKRIAGSPGELEEVLFKRSKQLPGSSAAEGLT